MKESIITLLLFAVLSGGTVQAAEPKGPFAKWLETKNSNISSQELSTSAKAQAGRKKVVEKESALKIKQAKRENEAAARRIESEKKRAERKKKVEAKKEYFKSLFSKE